MKLPGVDDLQNLDSAQLEYAAELIEILNDAEENVLLPNWVHRTEMMSELLNSYNANFALAVGAAACTVAGVPEENHDTIIGQLWQSYTEVLIDSIQGWGHESVELRKSWAGSVMTPNSIENTIQRDNPRFIDEIDMLGTEYKVKSIGNLLVAQSQGITYADLTVFIGKPLNNDVAIDFDPDIGLGDLERETIRYATKAKRGMKPIDPERLVGTVASAMRTMGIA